MAAIPLILGLADTLPKLMEGQMGVQAAKSTMGASEEARLAELRRLAQMGALGLTDREKAQILRPSSQAMPSQGYQGLDPGAAARLQGQERQQAQALADTRRSDLDQANAEAKRLQQEEMKALQKLKEQEEAAIRQARLAAVGMAAPVIGEAITDTDAINKLKAFIKRLSEEAGASMSNDEIDSAEQITGKYKF